MKNQYQVAYYYMPANEERPAEIIQIMNTDRRYIQVPMREEDIVLEAFFQRDMTAAEIDSFGRNQVWQIFPTWNELIDDHQRFSVEDYILFELSRYRNQFPLPEGMAA